LLLLVGTTAGVLGPIVLDLISSLHPVSALLLLGKTIKRKPLRLNPDPIAPQPQPVME
jgi:hypothetical protein